MSEESVIRVNFGRPVPLFPLWTVAMLPQGVRQLLIFEDRYKRMVEDVLETTGQIAMAVYAGRPHEERPGTQPALRPGVCLGRILDYQRLENGMFRIELQGMCRARILYELPVTEDCPYRQAMLEPVGIQDVDEESLVKTRMRLGELLTSGPLSDLRESPALARHVEDSAIPTSVLLELIAMEFISDPEVHYQLLEGAHARTRSRLIERELLSLARLLRMAAPQRRVAWPKGCSWN